jgi:hypothetical protein
VFARYKGFGVSLIMRRIVLISCVSKKMPTREKAKDLYVSPLFRLNMRFALLLGPNLIFILSAKYGLVDIEQELDPYEQSLNNMPVKEIKAWAEKVKDQMKGKIDFENDEIIFLAGEKYRKYLVPLFKNISIPLKGLTIGKQLQFLKGKISHAK